MSRDHALNSRAARLGRRELLSWGLAVTSATLMIKLFDMGLRFARPNAVAGEFGGKFDLGEITDLPDADAPPVNYPAGRFFLVRTSTGVSAFYKVCTHLSCLLTWDDQTKAFVCPCHGSQFDHAGALVTGPASRNLNQFAVQLVTPDGQVVAETDSLRGGPVAIPGMALRQKTSAEATITTETNEPETADGGEENSSATALRVIVDTGQSITGRPGGVGTQRGS
jgi:cytochrome b6-f complex iron-sulfur subunit